MIDLFSDIDSYLREKGFQFFDMIGMHYVGREDSNITASHMPGLYPIWGQLIEAHGIYFRGSRNSEFRGEDPSPIYNIKILKPVRFAELFGKLNMLLSCLSGLDICEETT